MISSNSTIAEIKDRLNVADVLSMYIQLKKAGVNFKAACPFHSDSSPSLMVSTSKQIWRCFGCGEGGDIFTFVMKFENVDFSEALKILADRAGVELPKYTKTNAKAEQYKDRMYQINELAAKFYNKILFDSPVGEVARKYLLGRGMVTATLKEWQIGFAPDGYHYLEEFLLKKGYTKKELLDSGVSSKSERGDVYDRFFRRVTYPIKSYSGQIVGFTARILDETRKGAKYINSPETIVYSKSKVIFGLYQAKQHIRKTDEVVVVEGNMDVIAAHQAGFKNVVGSSGTAFTFDQLQMLSRLTKNLKFAFDTDQAGAIATRRALEGALQLGFNVYIVKIEGAKDPDELIKKSPKLFEQAVAKAQLYLDFFFDQAFAQFDPNSIEDKKRVVAELVPLLQTMSDPLELSHYVKLLAQRLATPESTIYEYLAKGKIQKSAQKSNVSPHSRLVKSRSYYLEQKILGYLLFRKPFREQVIKEVDPKDIKDPHMHALFKEAIASQADSLFHKLSSDMAELAKMAQFVVESEYSEIGDAAAFEREFVSVMREFKETSTRAHMRVIMAEMVAAEKNKDKPKLAELNTEFLRLSKILKENQ